MDKKHVHKWRPVRGVAMAFTCDANTCDANTRAGHCIGEPVVECSSGKCFATRWSRHRPRKRK